MRTQTACRLTVRLAWEVGQGQYHPPFTFLCVEDVEMAATAARYAAEQATRGIRFLGVAVSATGGKAGPWEPIALPWPREGTPPTCA